MTVATYRSTMPADPEAAQAIVAGHVPGLDGWCRACGAVGPCGPYLVSSSVLLQFGLLPRREPGATRTDRRGGRRFGWWDGTQ